MKSKEIFCRLHKHIPRDRLSRHRHISLLNTAAAKYRQYRVQSRMARATRWAAHLRLQLRNYIRVTNKRHTATQNQRQNDVVALWFQPIDREIERDRLYIALYLG